MTNFKSYLPKPFIFIPFFICYYQFFQDSNGNHIPYAAGYFIPDKMAVPKLFYKSEHNDVIKCVLKDLQNKDRNFNSVWS